MRLLLRLALVVGAISGLGLLGLLAWSTGNASRFARYYDVLLILNGIFALALFVWVVALTVRLARQIRRRQFGARLTARFALAFALIGVVPGALIYTVSVQFMSRSIESWFNVLVDTALEAGLNLGRAAGFPAGGPGRPRPLDGGGAEPQYRRGRVAGPDAAARANGVQEAMVFTGSGRMVAFSTNQYGQLLPAMPPAAVMNQLRVARGYSAAEADDPSRPAPTAAAPARHHCADRPRPLRQPAQRRPEPRWLQLLQPVPEQIAHNANQVQQGSATTRSWPCRGWACASSTASR